MSELTRPCTVASTSFDDNTLKEVRYNETILQTPDIGTDVDPDILSEIITFFLDENISPRKNILLLPSRTSREQTAPMLRLLYTPATIPVLNYHKPLTPARTKLFLHSDSKQLIVTVLFGIEYSIFTYLRTSTA